LRQLLSSRTVLDIAVNFQDYTCISLEYDEDDFTDISLPTNATSGEIFKDHTSGEIEEKADGFITSSQQVVVYFMAIKITA
jgi:hypothetical protein